MNRCASLCRTMSGNGTSYFGGSCRAWSPRGRSERAKLCQATNHYSLDTYVPYVVYVCHELHGYGLGLQRGSAMRRQFEHRARLVVYLENADVQRMTARAFQDGMVLMDWVRETLLGELDELPTRGSDADIGSAKRKGSVAVRVRKEADVPAEPDAGAGHHVHAGEGLALCGHPAEPGRPLKCRQWGCVNYAYQR